MLKNPRLKKKKRSTRRKPCHFCQNKLTHIDYKDVAALLKFTNITGKITARKVSGNCALHQRIVAKAVKRSRAASFLPFTKERVRKSSS